MSLLIGQEQIWKQCCDLLKTPCHLFITGPPGSGKTTLVRELLSQYAKSVGKPYPEQWGQESNDECLLLTSEQDRGIQAIRGQVSLFIRQMNSISQSSESRIWRWVIIDDVDTFPHISQQALRRSMETYSHITRFIFIGNSTDDLISALHSRCIHISMNTVNPIIHKEHFLKMLDFENTLTEEMWSWILNISQNNIADMMRIICLIRDTVNIQKIPLTIHLVQTLCSAPFYVDFFPLLNAIYERNLVAGSNALIHIWHRGYTFEDTLESFQMIHTLFSNHNLENNIMIHIFLTNAWISYCKGNTSLLSMINVLHNSIKNEEISLINIVQKDPIA